MKAAGELLTFPRKTTLFIIIQLLYATHSVENPGMDVNTGIFTVAQPGIYQVSANFLKSKFQTYSNTLFTWKNVTGI